MKSPEVTRKSLPTTMKVPESVDALTSSGGVGFSGLGKFC